MEEDLTICYNYQMSQQFTDEVALQVIAQLKAKEVVFGAGLNDAEIARIENALGLKLPPDLVVFYRNGLPIGPRFPQWRENPELEVKETWEALERSFIFDIENSGYWIDAFGGKPDDLKKAGQQAFQVVRSWPPLVRIYAHRYMPTYPHQPDLPVLSVWQPVDTIVYGNNLVDYLVREFDLNMPKDPEINISDIPYWGAAFFEEKF